jgi:hypothetical protein
MSAKPSQVRRAVDKKGRNKFGPPYVQHYHWVLDTAAYRDLRPLPRALYTFLRKRFNGKNNGHIFASVRDVEKELHCSKDSASAAFRTLEDHGFILCSRRGTFSQKLGRATSWILTEEEYQGQPPTKDFTRWTPPENSETGTQGRTRRPQPRTVAPHGVAVKPESVPNRGPRDTGEQGSRSLSEDVSNIPGGGDGSS